MNKFITIDREKYSLEINSYIEDPLVLGISIINAKTGELYDVLTTNLGTNNGNNAVIGKGKSYVNESRTDLIEIIQNNNLGKIDMRFGEPARKFSGFNSYLIFEFDLNVLAEYDKDGVEQFKETYDENFEKELNKLVKEIEDEDLKDLEP